jgi:hypothetical protein
LIKSTYVAASDMGSKADKILKRREINVLVYYKSISCLKIRMSYILYLEEIEVGRKILLKATN